MKRRTGKKVNEAARLLGKRSARARRKKWGTAEFKRRMREWGKLGGRPKGSGKEEKP
jgi:hypothetical protein